MAHPSYRPSTSNGGHPSSSIRASIPVQAYGMPSRQHFVSPPLPPHIGTAGGLPTFSGAPPIPPTAVPPGTLPPGTIVSVGKFTVKVERFLSEGGFAHVYLATSETPIPQGSPSATTKHVLKRVAVPDKAGVQEVGREVEVMKLLRDHPKIVNMIEASVQELPNGGGYEIYILMEWCAGGGIIDMMNTRLQNRLTETEILKIFGDTVEAVAYMHYQNPPLIHRDLKVENILLSPPQTYKLCDFGSTTVPLKRIPTAVAEIQALESEINKTTTLQYRAPEIVDVWSRRGYDEKLDIWALGVLLYKLCYYTTPFEEQGPLAIMNVQYKIPAYPAYSNAIKLLIGSMLQEKASQRPNIYQVHEQVCRLCGTNVKLENKYINVQSPNSSPQVQGKYPSFTAPTTSRASTPYADILSSSPGPPPSALSLADQVAPMRRGRPSKTNVSITPASDTLSPTSTPSGQDKDAFEPSVKSSAWSAFVPGKNEPLPVERRFMNSTSGAKSDSVYGQFTTNEPSASQTSFGDSFATLNPAAALSSAASGVPFSSLLSPPLNESSLIKSLTGERLLSKQHKNSSSSTSLAERSIWGDSKKATPAQDPDQAKFEADYPSLEAIDSTAPFKSSETHRQAPVIEATSDSGPPLPRRPLETSNFSVSSGTNNLRPVEASFNTRYPSTPELISRSSQTSPNLSNNNGFKLESSSNLSSAKDYERHSDLSSSIHRTISDVKGQQEAALSKTLSGTGSVDPPLGKAASKSLLDDSDEDEEDPIPASNMSMLPKSSSASFVPSTYGESSVSGGSTLHSTKLFLVGKDAVGESPQTGKMGLESSRLKFRPSKPADPISRRLSTLGTDFQNDNKALGEDFAPRYRSKTTPKPANEYDDVSERYPALENMPEEPLKGNSRSPQIPGSPRERIPPLSKKEDVQGEESSEDEMEAPEDYIPIKVVARSTESKSIPPSENSRNLSTSEAPNIVSTPEVKPVAKLGVADQKLALDRTSNSLSEAKVLSAYSSLDDDEFSAPPLTSIKKNTQPSDAESFSKSHISGELSREAPAPVIRAPQPRSSEKHVAITNLVSRYETMSTTESEVRRPQPPPKPANLRKSSDGQTSIANSDTHATKIDAAPHWSSPKADPNNFVSRFSDSEAVDDLLSRITVESTVLSGDPSSPTNSRTIQYATNRPQFKPTAPASPSTTKSWPKPVNFPPSTKQPTFKSRQSNGSIPKPDEEEKFAGVSNMKNRWESMNKSAEGDKKAGTGERKAVARKEWAVV